VKVVVVGGGVIGLCCAYALRRAGAEDVTVIDRGRFGQGASLGNAGWVTQSLSAPIPGPGVMAQALRWMGKPDSPLLLKPRVRRSFLLWCWSFWRSCSPERYRAGLRATLALNARTPDLFDELQAEGVEFEMHSTGLLLAALSEYALRDYRTMAQELEAAGYRGELNVLGPDVLRDFEPALAEAVVGGLYAPSDRFVRPESLIDGLVDHLRQAGVEMIAQTEVQSLVPRRAGSSGWRVVTSVGEMHADRVIVASGVWSAALLAKLGVRIRLEAAKGYSVTASGSGTRPQHPLYLTEAKVACSPFAGGVRLAGTLELGGLDTSLNRRRLDAVVRAASVYLHDWTPEGLQLEWAGLRPLTPDGLPLIGAVQRLANLYLATGHGMLGVTLAPATGEALATLVLEDKLVPELVPFAPDGRR
jgi:D-amino-acid dehydrogenase